MELAMPFKVRQFYNRRSKTPKTQPKRPKGTEAPTRCHFPFEHNLAVIY